MIEIRRAKVGDSQEISAMIKASAEYAFKDVYPQKHIDHTVWLYRSDAVERYIEDMHFFIALNGGEIVGSICIRDQGGHMTGLYVSPEYVGKRIGRMLVEKVEEFAREQGYDKISLQSTLVGQGFYSHMGYATLRDIEEEGYVKYIEMEKTL